MQINAAGRIGENIDRAWDQGPYNRQVTSHNASWLQFRLHKPVEPGGSCDTYGHRHMMRGRRVHSSSLKWQVAKESFHVIHICSRNELDFIY